MRRKLCFLLGIFLFLQGSPYKTLLWACAARTCGYLCREVPTKPICRVASRPCTPGSISYREEMDERRAKNLLVFGFPAKGVMLDPL